MHLRDASSMILLICTGKMSKAINMVSNVTARPQSEFIVISPYPTVEICPRKRKLYQFYYVLNHQGSIFKATYYVNVKSEDVGHTVTIMK